MADSPDFNHATRSFLRRLADVWLDPIRLTHVFTQIVMVYAAVFPSILLAKIVSGLWVFLLPVPAIMLYYGLYEFVLEPIAKWMVKKGYPSLVGPYWERGPQDGETFTRE